MRKSAAQYAWRLQKLVASSRNNGLVEQDVVNSSTISPLSEASTQSVPFSPLDMAADLSIPSQSNLPRMNRDGQPTKPEIHTTRTECNNTSRSLGLHLATLETTVGPDRGSHKRNRIVSKTDSKENSDTKRQKANHDVSTSAILKTLANAN